MITDSQPEKLSFDYEEKIKSPSVWFLGRLLIWSYDLKRSLIFLERTKEHFKKIIEFFVWLLIFAGIAAFAFWLFANQEYWISDSKKLLLFFTEKDPLIIFFLLTLWLDLFMIYQKTEARDNRQKINYKKFSFTEKKGGNEKVGKKYNVSKACSLEVKKTIEDAFLLAVKLGHHQAACLHVFRALLYNKEVQALFIRLNADAKRLVEMVDNNLTKIDSDKDKRHDLSLEMKRVMILAFIDAYESEQNSIGVLNLLAFCCQEDPLLADILYELEIDEDKLKNGVAWFKVNKKMLDNYNSYRRLALLKPDTSMNRAYTAIATPTLDHFSHDLTIKAKYGMHDICVGRDREIKEIFEAFTGGHNGVILVGATGVGKSSIINGLAKLMVEEKVPKFLKDKRLVELDISRLVSGADASAAQERLLTIINEVNRSGNIILYIDNVENLIGISAGSQESLDLSEVLAEALSRRHIFCLAAATTENYSRYIENRALGNSLTTIGIKEPAFNDTIKILESKAGSLEAKYDVFIVYSALEQAVKMAERYLHDKFLPLKAIELLEKAALVTAKNAQNDPSKSFCTQEEVALAIGEMTGIPVNQITIDESEKLLNLEKEIHKRLIGQEEAVKAVSASLRRARVQLKDSKRPIASFLFLGPTGVGKTELAKAVSEAYFGDEDYLTRIDMSEYQNQDSVKKMIGDSDGTLGYLTEAVRKKPFSLILLDEVEKAHPDILNLFLQLLDDGRLTDGQGRTINFSESIIIATSNIGALYIQEQIKLKTSLALIRQELIDNQLNKHMRPELINRFDGIIVFKPLSMENVLAIATLMLKKIKKTLEKKGVGLKADKDGVAILAKEGYDPKFGARPLRRLLQEKVEDDIANKFLKGELKRRDTIVINSQAILEIEKAPQL